jgi:hypothetical protein
MAAPVSESLASRSTKRRSDGVDDGEEDKEGAGAAPWSSAAGDDRAASDEALPRPMTAADQAAFGRAARDRRDAEVVIPRAPDAARHRGGAAEDAGGDGEEREPGFAESAAAADPENFPESDDDDDEAAGAAARERAAEIALLRRRLEDLATQQRKSHTAVQQLADSVAALVGAHRKRIKGLNLNSFVAYLIFTVLLGTAFYMMYARRAGALAGELQQLRDERDRAAQGARAEEEERKRAQLLSQRALELFELYQRGDTAAALARHGSLVGKLSPLEEAALLSARQQAAQASFDRSLRDGLAAFRAGSFAAAVEPLRVAAAAGAAAGPRLGEAHYYLGLSLARSGEPGAAISALDAALAASVDIEDARYQLATTLDRAGQLTRARAEYETFASGHPKHAMAVFAVRRAAVLARWGKAAAPLPAPIPAAPGARPPTRWGGVRVAPRPPAAAAAPAPAAPPADEAPAPDEAP